jgi:hypothetical protein
VLRPAVPASLSPEVPGDEIAQHDGAASEPMSGGGRVSLPATPSTRRSLAEDEVFFTPEQNKELWDIETAQAELNFRRRSLHSAAGSGSPTPSRASQASVTPARRKRSATPKPAVRRSARVSNAKRVRQEEKISRLEAQLEEAKARLEASSEEGESTTADDASATDISGLLASSDDDPIPGSDEDYVPSTDIADRANVSEADDADDDDASEAAESDNAVVEVCPPQVSSSKGPTPPPASNEPVSAAPRARDSAEPSASPLSSQPLPALVRAAPAATGLMEHEPICHAVPNEYLALVKPQWFSRLLGSCEKCIFGRLPNDSPFAMSCARVSLGDKCKKCLDNKDMCYQVRLPSLSLPDRPRPAADSL